MGVKREKPTTQAKRFTVKADFKEITRKKPEKSLLVPLKKKGGRNNGGRMTVRRRGGGHKRRYRKIDFKRDKYEISGEVIAVEYDPNRSARIALIKYEDGEKRYILWPKGLKAGDKVVSAYDEQVDVHPGNAMKLKYLPLGTVVHNVELQEGRGGVFIRSAGSWAQCTARERGFVQLKLPSGEVRVVKQECRATIGQLGNIEHSSKVLGKAGRRRWLGRRSKVRGVAMNPIDHPHGGGEGKAGQGNPHPVSPWGKPAKGGRTRRLKKKSNQYIVKRRKKKRKG